MGFITANFSTIATLTTLIGGYIWHRWFEGNKAKSDSAFDSAMGVIGGFLDQWAMSASSDTSIANLRVQLKGAAAVQLARLKIFDGTPWRPLAELAVDAAIERAIALFVREHPSPTGLHAEVKASGTEPLTRIA